MIEFNNTNMVKVFSRNLGDPEMDKQAAIQLGNKLRSKVKSRTAQGKFMGGPMAKKSYSSNPIKAWKLGQVNVSGKGMGKVMTIDGKQISGDDWFWGDDHAEAKGYDRDFVVGPADWNMSDTAHEVPHPIFIPGYRGWITEYNGLSDTVNLKFTGEMMKGAEASVYRGRGSNQYGGAYTIVMQVAEDDRTKGRFTDKFRHWKGFTQDELESAMSEVGEEYFKLMTAY